MNILFELGQGFNHLQGFLFGQYVEQANSQKIGGYVENTRLEPKVIGVC